MKPSQVPIRWYIPSTSLPSVFFHGNHWLWPSKGSKLHWRGKSDWSSHFLFPAHGLAQSRSPKILWGQGMQEVSSSLVHLSEGVSLSSLFQILPDIKDQENKSPPTPRLRTNGHGLWKCYARLSKCYWLSYRNCPPIQLSDSSAVELLLLVDGAGGQDCDNRFL